ncbi:hypothetical protein BASA60_008142 [Batrachochytrium salamandrivorans]|nr:hypothetical protein BASA60_008142 [Batrachochytrium salamandrivorans]
MAEQLPRTQGLSGDTGSFSVGIASSGSRLSAAIATTDPASDTGIGLGGVRTSMASTPPSQAFESFDLDVVPSPQPTALTKPGGFLSNLFRRKTGSSRQKQPSIEAVEERRAADGPSGRFLSTTAPMLADWNTLPSDTRSSQDSTNTTTSSHHTLDLHSSTSSPPVSLISTRSRSISANSTASSGSSIMGIGLVSSANSGLNTGPVARNPEGRIHSPIKLINRLRNLGTSGITKDYWMRDEKVRECYDCKQPFSTFRRKHHCRICGQIFCRKCASSIVPGIRFGHTGEMRVCNFCLKIMDDYKREGPSQVDPATLSIGSNSSSHVMFLNPHHTSLGPRSPSHSSLQISSPTPASSGRRVSSSTSLADSDTASGIGGNQVSGSFGNTGGAFGVFPNSSGMSNGSSVDGVWGARNISMFRKVEDSRASFSEDPLIRAPFSTLVNPPAAGNTLERNAQLADDMQDPESVPYITEDEVEGVEYISQIWTSAAYQDSLDLGIKERASLSLSDLHARNTPLIQSQEGTEAWRQLHMPSGKRRSYSGSFSAIRYPPSLPGPSLNALSSTLNYSTTASLKVEPHSELSALVLDGSSVPDATLNPVAVSSPLSQKTPAQVQWTRAGLNAASVEHMRRMLCQTLNEASVNDPETWVETLMNMLIKAAGTLRPDLRRGDDIDIRNYIKIKKIPGGVISDCRYIDGIVSTKQAIHKNMLRVIYSPRILLIVFPLAYQRVENQFVSLETLVAQEEDHIKHLVGRVTALEPNVVLVQKTVSRTALEMLLKANIIVVHNVKPSVIIRIARCTNADIIHSIDKLALNPQLGTCESFSFKAFVNRDIPGLRKTFMYFEGCRGELGCSFILRGSSVDQLRRVKRVLDLMIFVAYSLRLETSLLRDIYALTPNLPQIPASDKPSTPGKLTLSSSSQALVLPATLTALSGDNTINPTTPVQTNLVQAVPVASATTSSSTPLLSQASGQKDDDIPAHRAFKQFQTTILSGSPSVKFPAPYLLLKLKELSSRKNTANAVNSVIRRRTPIRLPSIKMKKTLSDLPMTTGQMSLTNQNGHSAHDRPVSLPSSEILVDDTVSQGGGRSALNGRGVLPEHASEVAHVDVGGNRLSVVPASLDPRSIIGHVDSLSPFTQQNITVLYSNICRGNTVSCIPAHQSLIEYYGDSDLTLGQYLENLCLESCFVCPVKGCEHILMAHSRIYAHGNYRVIVDIDSLPCPVRGMEDHIIMWSMCKICHVSTPFVHMSEESWKYSFGKYLELQFYLPKLNCRAINCTHDIHRDHISYFSLHNLTLRFQMESICLFEVSVPPMRRLPKTEYRVKLRQQDLEALRHQIELYYDSILHRIKLFTIDIVPVTKQQSCKETMIELGKRASSERKLLLQLLQQTFITSATDDHLALNAVFFLLLAKVASWDSEFTLFVRTFLQPEQGDVRRMAGQIKRIFADRETILADFRLAVPTVNAPSQVAPQFDLDLDLGAIPANSLKLPVLCSSPIVDTVELSSVRLPEDPEFLIVSSTAAISTDTAGSVHASMQDQSLFDQQQHSQPPTISQPLNLPPHFYLSHTPHPPPLPLTSFVFINRRLSFAWMRTTLYLLENSNAPVNTPALGSSPSDSSPIVDSVVESDELTSRIDSIDILDNHHGLEVGHGVPPYWGRVIRNNSNINTSPEAIVLPRAISAASATSYGSATSTVPLQNAPSSQDGFAKGGGSSRIGSERDDDMPSHEQMDDDIMFPRFISSKPRSRVAQLGGSMGGNMGDTVTRKKRLSKGQVLADEDEPLAGVNMITGVAAEVEPAISIPQYGPAGERASIMKTITNLWNGNPANFLPIAYPSNPTEHVFPDSLIIVREDEPTSIMAFTLESRHYKEKLHSMHPGGGADVANNTATQSIATGTGAIVSTEDSSQPRYSIDFDDQFGDIEETLLRGTGTHIRYQFWDGPTRMHCKVFFAEQFDALRRNCGADEQYVQSLARCIKWDASGGRSGSTFLKTRDDWLVAKQLSRLEMDALYKFAPEYFEYMSRAFFHELPTILTKIFGFYRIGFKNPVTGKTIKMDLLVMENLFYDRSISRIFDLKGSMRNRHVQSTGKQNEVLMDENLVEFIYDSPLFIREHSKKLLRASVWNDTLFLSRLNVMDYSLLVGIDRESNELVVGIVDFIRTFTWDKKLESLVKETGFLGGGGKEPTVVTPRQYKNRFREAMEKYFLMVPDKFLVADVEGSLPGP